jgi:DNA-binding PadR family transcriptional regulator
MTTTLGYVLLNLLASEFCDGCMTGYDLAQLLKKPGVRFWYATHTQIYAELARLHDAGLVTQSVVEQDGKPDKKIYQVTESGLAALREWLVEPTEFTLDRDEFMVKAFGIWLTDPVQTVAMFRQRAQQHRNNLDRFEPFMAITEQEWQAEGRPIDSRWFGRYIVLKRLIPLERDFMEWCNWVADILEKGVDDPAE